MSPSASWNLRSVLFALTLGCVVLAQNSTTQSTALPFTAKCDTEGNIIVQASSNQNISVLLKASHTGCSPNETTSEIVYSEECQESGVLTLTLKDMDDIIKDPGDIYRLTCHIVNGTYRNLFVASPSSQDSSSSKPVSIPGVVGELDMVLQKTDSFAQYAGGTVATSLEIGQTDVYLVLRHNKPSKWTQSFVLFPVNCTAMSISDHGLQYEFWNIHGSGGKCKRDDEIIEGFTANVSNKDWDLTHSSFLPFEFVRKPSGRVLLQCSVLLCPSDAAEEWMKGTQSASLQPCNEVYEAYTNTCKGSFQTPAAPPAGQGNRRRRRRQVGQGRQLVHNTVLSTSFVATEPLPLDIMSGGAAVTSPRAAFLVVAMAMVTQIF